MSGSSANVTRWYESLKLEDSLMYRNLVCSGISIIFSFVTLVALCRTRELGPRIRVMLVSMTLNDSLFSFLCLLFTSLPFHLVIHTYLCTVWVVGTIFTFLNSCFSVAIITVDRLLALYCPLAYRQHANLVKTWTAVVGSWVLAILITTVTVHASVVAAGDRLRLNDVVLHCVAFDNSSPAVLALSSVALAGVVAVTIMHVLIWLKIRQRQRLLAPANACFRIAAVTAKSRVRPIMAEGAGPRLVSKAIADSGCIVATVAAGANSISITNGCSDFSRNSERLKPKTFEYNKQQYRGKTLDRQGQERREVCWNTKKNGGEQNGGDRTWKRSVNMHRRNVLGDGCDGVPVVKNAWESPGGLDNTTPRVDSRMKPDHNACLEHYVPTIQLETESGRISKASCDSESHVVYSEKAAISSSTANSSSVVYSHPVNVPESGDASRKEDVSRGMSKQEPESGLLEKTELVTNVKNTEMDQDYKTFEGRILHDCRDEVNDIEETLAAEIVQCDNMPCNGKENSPEQTSSLRTNQQKHIVALTSDVKKLEKHDTSIGDVVKRFTHHPGSSSEAVIGTDCKDCKLYSQALCTTEPATSSNLQIQNESLRIVGDCLNVMTSQTSAGASTVTKGNELTVVVTTVTTTTTATKVITDGISSGCSTFSTSATISAFSTTTICSIGQVISHNDNHANSVSETEQKTNECCCSLLLSRFGCGSWSESCRCASDFGVESKSAMSKGEGRRKKRLGRLRHQQEKHDKRIRRGCGCTPVVGRAGALTIALTSTFIAAYLPVGVYLSWVVAQGMKLDVLAKHTSVVFYMLLVNYIEGILRPLVYFWRVVGCKVLKRKASVVCEKCKCCKRCANSAVVRQ